MDSKNLRKKVEDAQKTYDEKKQDILSAKEKEQARLEAIEELKKEAVEALKAEEKAKADAHERAEEKIKRLDDRKKALEVLTTFKQKSEAYAEEGLSSVVVMELSLNDFDESVAKNGYGTHKNLVGHAKIVYNSLKSKDFEVGVEQKGHMLLSMVAMWDDNVSDDNEVVDF